MARRFGKFNPNQKRDSHGRWTKGGSAGSRARSAASRIGSGAKKTGKFLFVPNTPTNRKTGKKLTKGQIALHVGLAAAPLVLPIAFQGVGKLDTFIQTATQNKFTANQANYDRAKKAATFGLKVGQSSLKYAKKSRGVYNLTSMSGRKV